MSTIAVRPPLLRPRRVVLAGVCEAVARHLGMRPRSVRIVAVALAACGGAGVLLYLWLWAFVPLESGASRDGLEPSVTRTAPVAPLLLAVVAVAAAVAVAADLSGAIRSPLVPGILESALAAALLVVWGLVVDSRDPARSASGIVALRTAAAVILIVEGALLLLAQDRPLTAVLAVVLVVGGVVILIIPRLVGMWSELIGERSARAREEQRAEIAAHLHDSVLQTLALIQNRAEPQSDVARLARAQERELRDWLFAGTDPFAGDLATELNTVATALELEYAVRIDVVVVGDVSSIASAALTGAAREAMVNAARHAGGDVSVYLEATADTVEVFVRDRGAGFDAEAIPEGRFGIPESIIGRMQRAGGRAEVVSDEHGTEVHLTLSRAVIA